MMLDVVEQILPVNPFTRPGDEMDSVWGIVLHNTGNPGQSARGLGKYWGMLSSQDDPDILKTLGHSTPRKASSHYGVDKNEIILYVPEYHLTYHSGSPWWNTHTIGIEVCHPDESGKFEEETLRKVVHLAANICCRYGIDPRENKRIVRHYDITGKDCPRWLVENPTEFERVKRMIYEQL